MAGIFAEILAIVNTTLRSVYLAKLAAVATVATVATVAAVVVKAIIDKYAGSG
jgi:hypothetical protein